MSEPETSGTHPSQPRPVRLRDALLRARIEAAARTGVAGDLRDAEVARLEILKLSLISICRSLHSTLWRSRVPPISLKIK